MQFQTPSLYAYVSGVFVSAFCHDHGKREESCSAGYWHGDWLIIPLITSTISVPLEQHKPLCSSTYCSFQNQSCMVGSPAKALMHGQQPSCAVIRAAE